LALRLKHILLAASLLAGTFAWAQHPRDTVHPYDDSHPDSLHREEIHSLRDLFKTGHWNGHIRNHSMITQHQDGFKTQYANAIGMKIDFSTGRYKGFELGIAGLFTFDVYSSDLAEPDPLSGRLPVFELQLYDVNDPTNKHELDRLEALFLAYHIHKTKIVLGRQSIETPLVNPADGRMKPSVFQGASATINELKDTEVFLAWITHVSPRSTVEWYTMEESIGVYNQGYAPNGAISNYHANVKTPGLGIVGVEHHFSDHVKATFWNYLLPNLMNTSLLQIDWHHKLSSGIDLYAGVQGMGQYRLGDEGIEFPENAYIQLDEGSQAIGGQLGAKYAGWDIAASTFSINDKGRFLFPREWGRENFYVTVPRGRMEGVGDANAYAIHIAKEIDKNLIASLDVVHFDSPGIDDFEHNKYRMPDYNQINLDIGYKFHKWLEGMEMHLLYVYKHSPGEIPAEIAYYQTNFNHFNLITNFTF
jgi:hypothetical protein